MTELKYTLYNSIKPIQIKDPWIFNRPIPTHYTRDKSRFQGRFIGPQTPASFKG